MAAPRPRGIKSAKRSDRPASDSVDAFLASLDHPFKQEILALRAIILGADPSIAEGIKWNAPSFRTSEWFATFHLRAKEGVQLILHFGAKTPKTFTGEVTVADPESLLKWLAKDRATVKFRDLEDIERRRSAFAKIVRHWIKQM